MINRAPVNENQPQGPQARLLPLFDRKASPVKPGESTLFRNNVFQPPGADYSYIALPAPSAAEYEEFLPVARKLLDQHWQDKGDVKADVLRALVTILNNYVPEYAAAAAMTANTHDAPELMPTVVIGLSDGQTINIGRPRKNGGVLCTSFDRESALSWGYETKESPYGLRHGAAATETLRYRRIDKECAALYDTSQETDMMKPVEEILATILAATDLSRTKIFNIVDPAARTSLPRGPLRVQDPRP